ncbi:MAG: hypothetical protein WCE51_02090 [Chthoniobacterales bacterium]
MPNSTNTHNSNHVGNLVSHSVFAHADSLIVLASAQLPTTRRPRILSEGGDAIDNLIVNAGGEPT